MARDLPREMAVKFRRCDGRYSVEVAVREALEECARVAERVSIEGPWREHRWRAGWHEAAERVSREIRAMMGSGDGA